MEYFYCAGCGMCLFTGGGDQVTVTGISGFHQRWCWICAGYDYQNRAFAGCSGSINLGRQKTIKRLQEECEKSLAAYREAHQALENAKEKYGQATLQST